MKKGRGLAKGTLRQFENKKLRAFRGLRQNGAIMSRKGPKYDEWRRFRDQWFVDNSQEWYECSLQISYRCPKRMRRKNTTLDHVKPRSTHPQLEYEPTNIKTACGYCNGEKGSQLLAKLGH